jgi:hypothetical protein
MLDPQSIPPLLHRDLNRERSFKLSRLLFPSLIHALAGRTPPAGERGSAAGSLLSSRRPKYTWACVLCRPSPELPFHFVWFLGWSTRHLALDPSSVLYLQAATQAMCTLCPYLAALQHLPPPQPVPCQLLPLRHIQLTQPRLYTSRLLAFHCFLCDHRSCVQRALVGLVAAAATRQAVPCWLVVWRSKARQQRALVCWPFNFVRRSHIIKHVLASLHWRSKLYFHKVLAVPHKTKVSHRGFASLDC